MSEAKFTKGEWLVLGEIVVAKKGAVNIKPLAKGAITPQEDEANAHLIAVAPEMYEMLELLINGDNINDHSIVREVESLLAKSKGDS